MTSHAVENVRPMIGYVNGLTDGHEQRREKLILLPLEKIWKYETWHLHVNWFEDLPYEEMLSRDVERVRGNYPVKGKLVLMGASAGDSHALNIFGQLAPELDDLGYIGLCGRKAIGDLSWWDWRTMEWAAKLDKPEPSPNFVDSINYLREITLPKLFEMGREDVAKSRAPITQRRMSNTNQLFDPVVPSSTQTIEGVPNHQRNVIGHGVGIFAGSLLVPNIIKRQFKLHN